MKRSPLSFFVETGVHHLRFGARGLRRAPGFSLAVVTTLVLCLGLNTAILSALYSLVLKTLPFPDSGQLVTVVNLAAKRGGQIRQSSAAQYRDFAAQADLFNGFGLVSHQNITIEEGSNVVRLPSDFVTASFFHVLGVQPVLGRFFNEDEEVPGSLPILILSEAYWRSRYQADPNIVGRVLDTGGLRFTIVGVAPQSLASLSAPTCFFQPYPMDAFRVAPQARYRGDNVLIGRLRPNVSLALAAGQLAALERRFYQDVAGPSLRKMIDSDGYQLEVQPLRAGGQNDSMPSLWLLQGGALLVLLIGAVNVVNLFVARMNARRADFATRVALGASRATLVGQSLAESFLLATFAVGGGLALAGIAIHVFNHYLPLIVRMAEPVRLERSVVLGSLGVTALLALLIGALPLQLLWKSGLSLGAARTSSSGRAARRVSSFLVLTQVAVAVTLLVGASLLIRSFAKVLAVAPGFDAAHVVQGRIALSNRYASPEASVSAQQRILSAMREISGVESVAEVSNYGLVPDTQARPFYLRGDAVGGAGSERLMNFYVASPDIFTTLGMKFLAGHSFDEGADFAQNPVVVVDQRFVERYFPGEDVVGREISFAPPPTPPGYRWPRIIGVVTRANLAGLEQRDNAPFGYVPVQPNRTYGFNVLVRSQRPTSDLISEMRRTLRAIDPALPLYLTASLQEGIDDMLLPRRGITLLLGLFAGLALLLAAVGLYGVLAYDVSQRTREIGIRGAIGATRGQIIVLILRQGLGKTLAGLVVGSAGALYLTRYLESQLFDVASIDIVTYALVGALLLLVALLACWLPAHRAAKVDPVVALRAE